MTDDQRRRLARFANFAVELIPLNGVELNLADCAAIRVALAEVDRLKAEVDRLKAERVERVGLREYEERLFLRLRTTLAEALGSDILGSIGDLADAVKAEIDRLRAEVDRLKAELDHANDHRHGMIESLERQVETLRAEVDRLKAKRARLLQFGVGAKAQIDRLKAELDRAKDDRHGMIESLERQAEALRAELALERDVLMRMG